VAGLYNDVALQPAPPIRPIPANLLDFDERRILLPPLPAEAQFFYDELSAYRPAEFRAGWQTSAEFDAQCIPLGQPPSAFDEVDWQRFAGTWFSQAISEADTGLTPPQAPNAFDEVDWQRFAGMWLSQATSEQDTGLTPPQAPNAFDEVDWQRFAGTWFSQATSEADTGLTPIVPGWSWDEIDWQRAFALLAAFPVEDEQPERLPYTPPPVPNLGWDDFDWNHDFGARGLALLVAMDDFVNAPLGGGTGTGTPRGRAARLGFGMPAFR
jgi:hypothetical protein